MANIRTGIAPGETEVRAEPRSARWFAERVPDHFAVVKTRTLALAVRFVEHTHIGRGGSDYGGATYEWVLQSDGSGDFSRGNVVSGKGSLGGTRLPAAR